MRGIPFGLGQMSTEEKSDIIKQHQHIYDGYRTMQPQVSNTQPLYVYDSAGDKDGITVTNKGEVKKYTNFGINERRERHIQKEVCDECGSMNMSEGECSECGYKREEQPIEEMSPDELEKGGRYKFKFPSTEDDIEFDTTSSDETPGEKMYSFKGDKHGAHLLPKKHVEDYVTKDEKPNFRPGVDLGKSFEKMKDVGSGWKPSGNKLRTEETGHLDDIYKVKDINKNNKFDYVEEIEEQGGNAGDMDVSDVDSAYDFVSDGPGMGSAYPVNEFETMESAWADEELDEIDISGVQGVYGDMDPAYDFDSDGPGKAGPYQTRSDEGYEGEDEDVYWDKDKDDDELDLDIDKFNPEDKSWEEIKAHTGDWDEIDEELQELFIKQKEKISEMMRRMKVIK